MDDNIKSNLKDMAVRLFAGFVWLIMALGGRLLFAQLWLSGWVTVSFLTRTLSKENWVNGVCSTHLPSVRVINSDCHVACHWSDGGRHFRYILAMLASLWETWQDCDVVFIDLQVSLVYLYSQCRCEMRLIPVSWPLMSVLCIACC
jgi:hypothetical protein